MHGVSLAGGDTSESPGGKNALILADIVLVGAAPSGEALRRSGGAAGDALYVTGQLGGAAAQLSAMLRRSRRILKVVSTEGHPHLFLSRVLTWGRPCCGGGSQQHAST